LGFSGSDGYTLVTIFKPGIKKMILNSMVKVKNLSGFRGILENAFTKDIVKLFQMIKSGKTQRACAKVFRAISQVMKELNVNVVKSVALENAC
jgi:hypothetical protein